MIITMDNGTTEEMLIVARSSTMVVVMATKTDFPIGNLVRGDAENSSKLYLRLELHQLVIFFIDL